MQLIKGLACQILACLVVLPLSAWLSRFGSDIRLFVLLQAMIAVMLSALFRQPVWWRFIHLCFMPLVVGMLAFNLPSWTYLLVFLLLTLVFWGTVKGDVPLFLSSSAVSDALIAIAIKEHALRLADIGAGVGTVAIPLAQRLPTVTIDAMERAPLPWLITFCRCRDLSNVSVRFMSLWRSNLVGYDVVFAFLSPLVMVEVGQKVRREMRVGSLFISSSFPVPDWKPEGIIVVEDSRKTRLYCYRIDAAESTLKQ